MHFILNHILKFNEVINCSVRIMQKKKKIEFLLVNNFQMRPGQTMTILAQKNNNYSIKYRKFTISNALQLLQCVCVCVINCTQYHKNTLLHQLSWFFMRILVNYLLKRRKLIHN